MKMDQIIVIDLEATCWRDKAPKGEISDIIEVGVCPLDLKTLERGPRKSLLVKPTRSKVSAFCTELTTLTPELIEVEGMTLEEAFGVLKKTYRTHERPVGSWGDYDRVQIGRSADGLKLKNPLGRRHLNIKTLFAMATGNARECGLDRACAEIGQPLEGTHHRGHDDAHNIAGVLAWILGRARG